MNRTQAVWGDGITEKVIWCVVKERRSGDGLTQLHWACRYAGPDIVELLLSAGIDVDDHRNNKRVSPLFFATRKPYANAELLLARGAAINRRSNNGFTVLHQAALVGDADRVAFLLAHGADPEIPPWALAVRQGHRSIAAVLGSR